MIKRIVAVPKQQFLNGNAQLMRYATEGKASLSDEVKNHLKPDVLSIIEGKSDYALVRKLNKIGKFGAIRLNTASKLQLQSLNAQNMFKMVSFELQDPWEYYWIKVCENGSDPQKWLHSLKELSNIPVLVERCFRQMMLNNCYPRPEHYSEFMKACASMADYQSAATLADEFNRCTTRAIAKKPNPDLWKSLSDTFLSAKELDLAQVSQKLVGKRKVTPTAEQDASLNVLKGKYDAKAYADFVAGKTQTKPGFALERDDIKKSSLDTSLKQVAQFIQPPFEKLVSPDDLTKKRFEQSKATQKQ